MIIVLAVVEEAREDGSAAYVLNRNGIGWIPVDGVDQREPRR